MSSVSAHGIRLVLILMVVFWLGVTAGFGQQDEKTISGLLDQLESAQFAERQSATYRLIERASQAIPMIEARVEDFHPDSRERALGILKILAVEESTDIRIQARETLRRLESHRNQIVSDSANSANRLVGVIDQSRLVERLRQLGAGGSPKPVTINGRDFLVHREIQIHANWKERHRIYFCLENLPDWNR